MIAPAEIEVLHIVLKADRDRFVAESNGHRFAVEPSPETGCAWHGYYAKGDQIVALVHGDTAARAAELLAARLTRGMDSLLEALKEVA